MAVADQSPLDFAIAVAADRSSRAPSDFRRFTLALAALATLPPLLLAAFVIAVDPYYMFGSPSWPGFNAVRPYYEPHLLVAKPYQVWSRRPSAVALGSSRVEVGIDPRHEGWTGPNVFNFALPSNNSYATMLTFLHAQQVGSPLKQAVAGLDFFGYNINFALGTDFSEQRFGYGISADFDAFLDEIHPGRVKPRSSAAADTSVSAVAANWNEELYLTVNPDVAAAVGRKEFKSGREHWELAGRAERRQGGTIPDNWDEAGYLQVHPDVAFGVSRGAFLSGYHHYLVAGRVEGRLGGLQPKDWDEAGYLAANPDARTRIALGIYRSGYQHYAATARQGRARLGGLPPSDIIERLRLYSPTLNQAIFRLNDLFGLVFSTTILSDSINTVRQQSEPASFNGLGMRVWQGHEEVLRKLKGNGAPLYGRLATGRWRPWLPGPKFTYCFTNPNNGVTTFDPFRFMLRRAYAEGTDLRLFVTPNQAAIRRILIELGLGERYEFWLKELVRINESEAARAGREPLPLWDFSAPNTITREPIPLPGDLTPMRWYWEFSHYRKETGDLILDRIFGRNDPARSLPADFGVRLTGENIDTHLARSSAGLADWAASNSELVSQIVAAGRNPAAETRQAEATCW
jgi:hypothetical protein